MLTGVTTAAGCCTEKQQKAKPRIQHSAPHVSATYAYASVRTKRVSVGRTGMRGLKQVADKDAWLNL